MPPCRLPRSFSGGECRKGSQYPAPRIIQLAGIALLLMMTASWSTADGQQSAAPTVPRTVKFAGGETIIEPGADADHVVVKDAQGQTTAESWCDSGTFDSYVALFTKLKETTGAGDRAAVVKLAAYPFRVNGKKTLTFRNEAALSKAYDKVFTPRVLELISKAEPAAVFCRDGQGMLGDGVVWAGVSGGRAKALVVNREAPG
jgi:hypothetical protein